MLDQSNLINMNKEKDQIIKIKKDDYLNNSTD